MKLKGDIEITEKCENNKNGLFVFNNKKIKNVIDKDIRKTYKKNNKLKKKIKKKSTVNKDKLNSTSLKKKIKNKIINIIKEKELKKSLVQNNDSDSDKEKLQFKIKNNEVKTGFLKDIKFDSNNYLINKQMMDCVKNDKDAEKSKQMQSKKISNDSQTPIESKICNQVKYLKTFPKKKTSEIMLQNYSLTNEEMSITSKTETQLVIFKLYQYYYIIILK